MSKDSNEEYVRAVRKPDGKCEKNCAFRKYIDSLQNGQRVKCISCANAYRKVKVEQAAEESDETLVPDTVYVKIGGCRLPGFYSRFGDCYFYF